jgi:hypothetical protein
MVSGDRVNGKIRECFHHPEAAASGNTVRSRQSLHQQARTSHGAVFEIVTSRRAECHRGKKNGDKRESKERTSQTETTGTG